MNWLDALPNNRRRGSFPRCLLLLEGDRAAVASRLNSLVGLSDVRIEPTDYWMPWGLPIAKPDGKWDCAPIREAKLGQDKGFLSKDQRHEVTNWWLAEPKGANTPNWDIASTCKIAESSGLLLVEAKAHCAELKTESKPLGDDAPAPSRNNHEQIQNAIVRASLELNKALPGWRLSCDSHYQLTNRFAWSWKLASMGISVVLIYLGFLRATEMRDLGEAFADSADWFRILLAHSQSIVPDEAWGRDIRVGHALIKPLIRAAAQELPSGALT